MGRRVRKVVATWDGSAWVGATNRFTYDGWNVIAETRDGMSGQRVLHYVWGLDLSGTLQGAGGIGGLLAATGVASNTPVLYGYDANGNVGVLLGTSGTMVAHYEYDPYGNALAVEGSAAAANPYRFSTKYLDGETALYYYGLRFYTPGLGRWMSRDPLASGLLEWASAASSWVSNSEQRRRFRAGNVETARVYVLVGNNALGLVDYLGLATVTKEEGAASLATLAAALKAMCSAPCCKCIDAKRDKWTPCKPKECAEDAERIASGLLATWNAGFGKGPLSGDDTVGGYLCWDWAAAYRRSVFLKSSKCWTYELSGVEKPDPRKAGVIDYHYYLTLHSCKDAGDGCTVMVDDGWFDSVSLVHKSPWLPKDEWKKTRTNPEAWLAQPPMGVF